MAEINEVNEFNITLGGNIEQLDINDFVSNLLNINDIIQEINIELKTSKKINVTIKPVKKGSFDIFLQLFADAVQVGMVAGFFHGNNPEVSIAIIKTFITIFKVKKFLKGEEPKSIQEVESNNVKIENNDGNIIIIEKQVINIITKNSEIDKKTRKIFRNIDNNPDISSLEIKDMKGDEIFEATKDEFKDLAKESKILSIIPETFKIKVVKKASLSIFKIVFDGNRKWEFFYMGIKISALIKDESWLQKALVKNEVSFTNGDVLIADIEIKQKYNEYAKAYENEEYMVTEIYEVLTSRGDQRNLFDK